MYSRRLAPPERSFFLFGPRGTGKSTWLRANFPEARWYDLLRSAEFLRLLRDPDALGREVRALDPGSRVVIDEVQKLPTLLDEVHSVLSEHPRSYSFALTGSSARKLKRGGANLLAGRAVNRSLFPLTGQELNYEFDLDSLLRFGALPAVVTENREDARVDFLEAYAANYLREEIQQEAVVKNLDSFSRFLEISALMNGQVLNLSTISRDAAVRRPTVQGYFEVLIDTLIGFRLPAWKPRAKVKESQHAKFYLFDPGVARVLAGRVREPLEENERGPLLETLILNELRAQISYSGCGGELAHWRTPHGSEVDFVWHRGKRAVGIEVKAGSRWRTELGRPLRELNSTVGLKRSIAVYCGAHRLKDNGIDVLPIREFMKDLSEGKIFE